MESPKHPFARGLKAIAIFEAVKGLIVIVLGLGLLSAIHRDLWEVGVDVLEHLHLNPAHHYPGIFLSALDSLSPPRIKLLALGAAVYSAFRFVEAYGLWFERRWAEWVAIIACGAYLPVEAYHLIHHATWVKALITLINVAMILYLIRVRRSNPHLAKPQA